AGHSPVTSFYYGREDTGTYNTGAANAGSITSPVIALPSTGPIPFSFNYVLLTEGSTSFDTANVQVSTNGFATFTTVASRSTNLPNSSVWRSFSTDLSAFAGRNIQIRWVFDTVNSALNDFEGWYVDDVQVGVPADEDWYSVNVASAGTQLRFETRTPADGPGQFNNTLDPHIELYNPSGVLIASGITLSAGRNEYIEVLHAPLAGTY